MRNSVFDYVGNLDTLLAVCLGAVLATFGALIAERIQERRNHKRRERDAARFFGDILTSLDQVLDFTFQSQTFGDPWGALTQRLFKTALREAQIYERNRERLFDIQDMKLRSRIHIHFLTETFPLEALIDQCGRIDEIEESLNLDKALSKLQRNALATEREELQFSLEVSLRALKRERAKTPELCKELEIIAGVKFSENDIRSYVAVVNGSVDD